MNKRTMKRAKTLKLVLMGAALSGCSDSNTVAVSQEARLFANVEQCIASGRATGDLTTADCQKNFEDTKKLYPKDAPKFLSKEACEKVFGVNGCTLTGNAGQTTAQTASSNTPWMPVLAGMMIGSLLNNGQQQWVTQPLYGTPGTRRCDDGRLIPEQELCGTTRSSSGGVYSSYNNAYRTSSDSTPTRSDSLGRTTLSDTQISGVQKAAVQQNPALAGKSTAVSRGGFGAHASSSTGSSGGHSGGSSGG